MKTRNLFILAIMIMAVGLGSCSKDPAVPTGQVFNAISGGNSNGGNSNSGDVVAPTVTTAIVSEITQTTAIGGGNVTNDGGAPVTERGICWSTSHNPTINNDYAASGSGMGNYTFEMTGLSKNTTYYVRAYAKNSKGVAYGGEVSFTTLQQPGYTITVSANPSEGGTVSGGGVFQEGQSCIIRSFAKEGFSFVDWTENGSQIATTQNYSFIVDGDRSFVANFVLDPYTISVAAFPENGGNVSGGGIYEQGQSCTVTASANTGYSFVMWMENGSQVSTEANYSFVASGNRDLKAVFTLQAQAPTGAIHGLFSVSANLQVWFSQGNLQYQASSNTWRFAERQWDYVGSQTPDYQGNSGGTVSGSDNVNISQTYNGWIDLFGWGTSGYNHGAVCYQPWSTSQTKEDYFAYGQWNDDLNSQTGRADWGYNPIINGGNTENSGWRTLNRNEWDYLFSKRTTPSGIFWAKANVNGVNGVILLPDDWSNTYYNLNNANATNANYGSNSISASQWNIIEQHGAVFFPMTGYREESSVYFFDNCGCYWSASHYDSGYGKAHILRFNDDDLFMGNMVSSYCIGMSVRLVRSAE